MPISGTFLADFESFYAASQKAVVSLSSFESGGAKVEKQLNRTADSFSGTKIISDATLMARVFHDAGGAATFTTAELRRMGAVGAEAMEKLRKGGQPIPAQLMAMGRATREFGDGTGGAAGKLDRFNVSVGQADALLGKFGIDVPPVVRGLADLGSMAVTAKLGLAATGAAAVPAAAGVTAVGAGSATAAAGLGAMATAAVLVGTGFAGWKVGEWIGNVTGLTQAIADGTAAARGWGDMTGQKAAYSAEVLGRASKTAGRGITDMTEAMAINAAEAERLIAKNTKLGAANLQLAADDTKATAVIEANRLKLLKVEHELAVAQVASAEALRQKLLDTERSLQAQLSDIRLSQGGTTHDIEMARIDEWEANQLQALRDAGTATEANVALVLKASRAMRDGAGIDFEALSEISLRTAEQQRDIALKTYTYMAEHADQFTRGAIQAQREKYRELAFAATASGRAAVDGQDAGAAATDRHNKALEHQARLNKQIAIDNQIMQDSWYTIGPDGRPTAVNQITQGVEGRVTPRGDVTANNAGQVAADITRLIKAIAEYQPSSSTFTGTIDAGGGGMQNLAAWQNAQIQEAQRHQDNIAQLAYLEKLLARFEATPPRADPAVNVAVNVSGVLDPATVRDLSEQVGKAIVGKLMLGRQWSYG